MNNQVWIVFENLGRSLLPFDSFTHYSKYTLVRKQFKEFEKFCKQNGYTEKMERWDKENGCVTVCMRNKAGRECAFIANRLPIYEDLVQHTRGKALL